LRSGGDAIVVGPIDEEASHFTQADEVRELWLDKPHQSGGWVVWDIPVYLHLLVEPVESCLGIWGIFCDMWFDHLL